MHALTSIRLLLARHPWVYWALVAALAGGVGAGTRSALAGVDAARRSWGDQREVWIATDDVRAGAPIVATRREVPAAMVPAGALDHAPDAAIARQVVGRGEIVTAADVTRSAPAGLVPDGWVALSVTADGRFTTGDDVRVYSADRLVAAGVVVAAGEGDVMVAIPEGDAPAMATGLLAGAITIALAPGP